MALTEGGENMVMPVAPMYGGNGGFGGSGWGDGIWLILLLLFAGGWGNGFGGGGMDGGLYPWLTQNTQGGFNQAAVTGAIGDLNTAVTGGFAGVNTNLCNGFAGVNQALCSGFAGVNQGVANGFAQAEIADNARQIANMQQSFAAQTALAAQLNGMQAQQASCCCENRLGLANISADIAREACADRAAVTDALRDVIASNTANTQGVLNTINGGIQSIKDQMCQDKIDAKNELITQLQNQLSMAQLAASQNAQTAAIQAGQRALANEVEQYVLPTPRPAYIVQNPNCCAPNYGYGCGCGVA